MSSNVPQLLQIGLAHHQAGRLQEAQSVYETILKEQPKHPDALHLRGVIAHQTGKNELAVSLIEKAIEINPGIADFHNNCGEAHRALRNYDLAISQYEQAIAIDPDFAGAHNNLAIALKNLGRFEDALAQFKQILATRPDFAEGHYNMGLTFKVMGRLEEAVACYERAIALKPDYNEAHNNLGNVLRELGRQEDAIACYERALVIKPDHAEAHNNLGNAVKDSGRLTEALACYQRALAARPDYSEAHNNLGHALKDLGRLEDAVVSYEQALAIRPDYAEAHNNLGNALKALGRLEEAISHYERVLVIEPDHANAHNNLGNSLRDLGRLEEAISHYEQALVLKPDYAEAHRHLTMIDPRQEQLVVIGKLLSDPLVSEKDTMHYHFALGNILEDAKSFSRALDHYIKANAIKRKSIRYEPKNHSDYADSLINVYTEEYLRPKTAWGSDSQLPVFIVGMPRSGSTLVEQIVSSHPQVCGAGELASFDGFEKTIAGMFKPSSAYPVCMSRFNDSVARKLSHEYLQELARHSRTASRITDKMPSNFLRIGLIRILFPAARIIHIKRNALDTCTSIFSNYFINGNPYSFDLTELGHYYLDYERLMAHWLDTCGEDIFELQYEDLVMNQEAVSRQLIEYLDLEWDESCLQFHKNKRAVNTASSVQVRQPIYTNSVDRWKRYGKHLEPLIAILHGA